MTNEKKSAANSGVVFGVIMGLMLGMTIMVFLPVFMNNIITVIVIAAVVGIVFGTLCGLLFGKGMYAVLMQNVREFQELRGELENQGKLIYDEAASYMDKIATARGWLFLLNDSLYFKARRISAGSVKELTIPLQDIVDVDVEVVIRKKKNNMRYLRVSLSDGKRESFVVFDSDKWIKEIKEAKMRLL